jgi:hypothetical protein
MNGESDEMIAVLAPPLGDLSPNPSPSHGEGDSGATNGTVPTAARHLV